MRSIVRSRDGRWPCAAGRVFFHINRSDGWTSSSPCTAEGTILLLAKDVDLAMSLEDLVGMRAFVMACSYHLPILSRDEVMIRRTNGEEITIPVFVGAIITNTEDE